jgi:choline dehydrogenase-like flavoprotein
MLPSLAMAYTPWRGSQDWKERIAKYRNTMGHIILCREESSGRVYLDKNNNLAVSYTPGKKERGWILEGFIGLAKLLYVMGASEISTGSLNLPIWKRDINIATSDWSNDQSFLDFLSTYRQYGFDYDRIPIGSAHQMGTCRMSGKASKGVVDLRGKVWGKEGLYVADASVFPSASGVNPMITTMAFGEWIGRRLAEGLSSDPIPSEDNIRDHVVEEIQASGT